MNKKKAVDLQPGDRIAFSSRDLLMTDSHHQPLVAEVIRIVSVYPGDRLTIFTASGLLAPVAPEKEFLLVEGDFDPTATQTTYAPDVKEPEVVDGRSIE